MHQIAMGNDEESGSRIPLSQCRKIFAQRDYSHGLNIRFQTALPTELNGKIDERTWVTTVEKLNRLYDDAESVGARSCGETFLACITCYTSNLCLTSQFQKKLSEMSRYLEQQNRDIYIPRRLFITDPIERGCRVIEVSILSERAPNPVRAQPPPGTAATTLVAADALTTAPRYPV